MNEHFDSVTVDSARDFYIDELSTAINDEGFDQSCEGRFQSGETQSTSGSRPTLAPHNKKWATCP